MLIATRYIKRKNGSGGVKITFTFSCDWCHTVVEQTRGSTVRQTCSTSCAKFLLYSDHSERQKMSEKMIVSLAKEEVKTRRSVALVKMHARSGEREKRSASQKIAQNRPEIRAKQSAFQRVNQRRPEVRAKRLATLAIPERRDKRIARLRVTLAKPETKQKTLDTKRRNHSFGTSRGEDRTYDRLCEMFGRDNVSRQYEVNNWLIDFYIKTIDTFVQYDGKFYHWIDRPIELLIEKAKTGPTYKAILSTTRTDKKQNEWFKERGKTFIRIIEGTRIEEYFNGFT